MIKLPKDPMILLSYINTQLRDFYEDLDELCAALHLDERQLVETLRRYDYEYDKEKNCFW